MDYTGLYISPCIEFWWKWPKDSPKIGPKIGFIFAVVLACSNFWPR